MNSININLVIAPIFEPQIVPGTLIFREPRVMVVAINSNVLLKNVSYELLKKVKLDHLFYASEAFIKNPRVYSFGPIMSKFSPNATIGSIQAFNQEHLTIKIRLRGNIEDFTGFEERNNVCYNLLHILLKKHPYVRDLETNSSIREVIDQITNRSILTLNNQQLNEINGEIDRELFTTERKEAKNGLSSGYQPNNACNLKGLAISNSLGSTMDGNSNINSTFIQSDNVRKPLESLADHEHLSNGVGISESITNQKSLLNENVTSNNDKNNKNEVVDSLVNTVEQPRKKRTKIKYDPIREIPVLDEWFDFTRYPSHQQLETIANYLNIISHRHGDKKIKLQNLQNWFSYRKKKERQQKNNEL